MRADLMILGRLDFVRHDLFQIKLIHINNKMLPGECYDFSGEQHQYYWTKKTMKTRMLRTFIIEDWTWMWALQYKANVYSMIFIKKIDMTSSIWLNKL